MRNRKNFQYLVLLLVGVILIITSCTKPEFKKDTTVADAKLFPSGVTVPSNFNWSSVKTVNVRVSVNDTYNGKYFYSIELFDNDPKQGTGANLLSAGQAKQGQDFVGQIVVPTGLPYIYLRQTSPVGIPSITMVEVANVNSVTVSKSRMGESLRETTSASATETTDVVIPGDAIEITGSATITAVAGKSYVIKSGTTFSGEFNINNGTSNAKIYVAGTWKNPNYTLLLGDNNFIYTTATGNIEMKAITQNTAGGFVNYGTAKLQNLSTTNETLYSNYGTLTIIDKATFSNGNFSNYGTATIQTLTSTTASTKIKNEGKLDVKDMSLTNATLDAVCHTKIDNLSTTNAIINVSQNALLSIKKLESGGTTYNLAAASILNVWDWAKFNSNKNYMKGTGNTKALARLKKVDVENQWQAITYSGNLEIACTDHTSNGQWSIFYILNSPATLVPYDNSTVKIAGTSCNDGGNNDSGAGTTPVDQTITEVAMGTYSYAFEDNWPETGDYDLNDLVVDVNASKFQNSSNKIVKVVLKAKLRSVGATKRIAGAVQLDGVASANIKSVTYSRPDLVGTNLKLSSNGVESGQTSAVVTIVDDAHKAFGVTDTRLISTQNGNYNPIQLNITIEFNTPLDNFTYNNLNMFIVLTSETSSAGRNEVHLVGYSPTEKINKSLIENSKGTKLSINDPFKTVHNEPWALCVPISFVSPAESKNIKDVYPKFESWAVSGGTMDSDWYLKR